MMRFTIGVLALTLGVCLPVHAGTPAPGSLTPGLSGLSFLAGQWTNAKGTVADTGGTSTGRFTFTVEAGGAVLLRRDHTDLFDTHGKPAGSFDQIMMIYPEGGGVHADYSDGPHVIHYKRADVQPGHSVVFTSDPAPQAPVFRLSYELTAPGALRITFAMAAPGSSDFHPIATGTAIQAP